MSADSDADSDAASFEHQIAIVGEAMDVLPATAGIDQRVADIQDYLVNLGGRFQTIESRHEELQASHEELHKRHNELRECHNALVTKYKTLNIQHRELKHSLRWWVDNEEWAADAIEKVTRDRNGMMPGMAIVGHQRKSQQLPVPSTEPERMVDDPVPHPAPTLSTQAHAEGPQISTDEEDKEMPRPSASGMLPPMPAGTDTGSARPPSPGINLIPPTPQTSQETAQYATQVLLPPGMPAPTSDTLHPVSHGDGNIDVDTPAVPAPDADAASPSVSSQPPVADAATVSIPNTNANLSSQIQAASTGTAMDTRDDGPAATTTSSQTLSRPGSPLAPSNADADAAQVASTGEAPQPLPLALLAPPPAQERSLSPCRRGRWPMLTPEERQRSPRLSVSPGPPSANSPGRTPTPISSMPTPTSPLSMG